MNNHEFEIRESNTEERLVSGIAVPFGDTIEVGGIQERFERGSIPSVEGVKLFYGHKDPIGRVVRGEETQDGYVVEARISETEKGNEVLTLLRDGVLNKMSVGFAPVKDRKEDGVVVREEVALKEVSIVSFPAYNNADVLSVRQDTDTNENLEKVMETNNEMVEVREEIETLTREVASIREAAPVIASAPSWNSFGDFVKAVVRGDEDAVEMTRAYAGAVVSPEGPDSIGRDAWVNEALLLVDHGRPSLNAFRKAGLPEAGLNIDYPAVATNTIDVDTQAAQGDTLTFGKLSLQTKTTPVKTIGGWTDVSRQTIERSSVAYLSEVFRAMSIAYGKTTNDMFINTLTSNTDVASLTGVAGTAEGITGAVADASIAIYENAAGRPQFILASPDMWKMLVSLFAVDGRPIVGGSAPVNNIGTSNLPQMTANLFGLEVVVDPALPAGTLYIANSNAITTWESGGAPYRLSDEDITNLTNQFSIYGYIAFGVIYPEMIVKVETA
jgi:HK97 family phage prohead protease